MLDIFFISGPVTMIKNKNHKISVTIQVIYDSLHRANLGCFLPKICVKKKLFSNI